MKNLPENRNKSIGYDPSFSFLKSIISSRGVEILDKGNFKDSKETFSRYDQLLGTLDVPGKVLFTLMNEVEKRIQEVESIIRTEKRNKTRNTRVVDLQWQVAQLNRFLQHISDCFDYLIRDKFRLTIDQAFAIRTGFTVVLDSSLNRYIESLFETSAKGGDAYKK